MHHYEIRHRIVAASVSVRWRKSDPARHAPGSWCCGYSRGIDQRDGISIGHIRLVGAKMGHALCRPDGGHRADRYLGEQPITGGEPRGQAEQAAMHQRDSFLGRPNRRTRFCLRLTDFSEAPFGPDHSQATQDGKHRTPKMPEAFRDLGRVEPHGRLYRSSRGVAQPLASTTSAPPCPPRASPRHQKTNPCPRPTAAFILTLYKSAWPGTCLSSWA